MKHFAVIILLIFVVCILFATPTDEQIRQAASLLEVPYDDLRSFVQSYHTTNPLGAISITAETLCSEYLANELSANNRYRDQTIFVTGKVLEVKNDYQGYYARLEGVRRNYVQYNIDVYFANSALNRLANVSVGQTITVLVTCTGEKGFLSFILRDATFAN